MTTPGYDHEEVRCEAMADWDCENLLVGEPRTCCVCIGHDCEEAREERKKHPAKSEGEQSDQSLLPLRGLPSH